ncbi:Tyra-2 [Aphelenchoides bicaudatus]|nr:Tyra-2 [Aphelenchoides bicaudatus]
MLDPDSQITIFQSLKSVALAILPNILVFLVLYKNPRLQTVPNLLVGNLAFSDLLLGLFVLPLSSIYAVAGEWLFSETLCVTFVSVLWGWTDIGQSRVRLLIWPKRNKRTAGIMIVSVWISSALISLAPLLGWKQVAEHGNLVKINGTWQCTFLDLPSYTIYSATGSFFIPIIVMFFVYFKIYQAFAKHRARQIYRQKVIRKHIESTILHEISHVLPTSDEFAKEDDDEESSGQSSKNNDPPENQPPTKNGVIIEEDEEIEYGNNENSENENSENENSENENSDNENSEENEDFFAENPTQITTAVATCEQNSVIIRRNELKPPPLLGVIQNGDSQPRKPAIKNNHEKCVNFQKDETMQKCSNEKALMISYEKVKRHKQRKERNYRKSLQKKPRAISAAKERRGVKVLGIILGCFTVCWLPFFIISASRARPNPHIEMFITWLGYSNSAMNPIIYTVFNRDYQIALKRLFVSGSDKPGGLLTRPL